MSNFVSYFFNDFIHQVVGNIYRIFLEHITEDITDRFQTKTMATYHKAIQVLKDDSPEMPRATRLPAICVDPTLPINIEEKSRQLWRVPVATIFSRRLFDPIYQDENIRITPGFVRYESTVQVYMWFDSIYEMIDTELRLLQAFHGTERWSKPYGMEVLCPLPDRVYTYDNPDGIVINWPDKYIPRLLDTIDREIPMFPMYVSPLVKMTTLSDLSTRDKDSGEDIGTCALQADFQFEFEVPTFYLVESHWQIRNIVCTIQTLDTLTTKIFVKEINLIDDPDEPTDPENGIITPEHLVIGSQTDFSLEDVKKWIVYEIQQNDEYPIHLHISDVDLSTIKVMNCYVGGILYNTGITFDETNNDIVIEDKELYPPGSVLNIILF